MKAQVGTTTVHSNCSAMTDWCNIIVWSYHNRIHYAHKGLFVCAVTHPKPLFAQKKLMCLLSKPHCPCPLYRGLPTSVEKFQLLLKLFPSRINTFLRNSWKRSTSWRSLLTRILLDCLVRDTATTHSIQYVLWNWWIEFTLVYRRLMGQYYNFDWAGRLFPCSSFESFGRISHIEL